MESALYVGHIGHRRYLPKAHRFRYPFFMWFLNLDELDRLPLLGRWFSRSGFALSRFHRPDYYGDSGMPLADAIRQRMLELTGQPVEGVVCGLMNMRTLGVYFSPVNFYYGYDKGGILTHFLAEVSNIPWNERHQYGHFLQGRDTPMEHPKAFHVSPFNPVKQHYRWELEAPGENIFVQIDVSDERGQVFSARLELERKPLELASVRREILKKPAMTLSIVSGIYWQALKLFVKGVPYIPYSKEAI
jgi:DUF1365 family protein